MKSVFSIPVYNQINEFPTVLKELKETDLPCNTVLLVNNGSTDGCEKLIKESGFPYLDFKENKGIGYSIIQSMQWALDNGYDIWGGMAGNAKMLPSEMHRILGPVESGEADYVKGSRYLKGGESPNLPLFRSCSIPMVNVFVWLITGTYLSDATIGYRAIHLDIIRRANFDWKAKWLYTYGMEYYILAKVVLNGHIRWVEAPITMRYPEKGKPYSKIKPFIGWYHMLRPWIRARIDGATIDWPTPIK